MALRGHVFDKQLFSSDCYALVTDTFLGKQSGIIRGCDMTHTTSLIHINEGYFVVKGRPIQEEGGSNIEVEPGNIDGSYCKLICELDMSKNNTTTELNQVSYKIIEDATNYPVLTQEDITNNGIIYQFELAKFRRTLNGIEDFVDTRSFLNFDSIYEEVRNEIKKIEEGSIFVTEEELSEKGVIVSPTQPTTNEKVWIQKGKNLLDINSGFEFGWYNITNNGVTYDVSNAIFDYIMVAPSTTYTLSANSSIQSLAFAFFDIDKNAISVKEVNNTTSNTATTPDNCYYVRVWINKSGDYRMTYEILKTLEPQLEKGEVRTEYEPYIKAIHTKNDNGLYEEFYNENGVLSKAVTKEEVLNSYDWSNNATKPYSAKYINSLINIKAKGFNCGSTGTLTIPNVVGRGCILVNITKNAGIAYGIYSIWFNNGTILKTSKIAGEGDGLNGATLSNGALTLESEVWSIGFYVLYCES